MTGDTILQAMSPIGRLFPYMWRYRREFLIGLMAVVLTSAISLVAPMVLRYAIDDLTMGVTRLKLFEYGGMLLAIGVVGGMFRFLMRRILMGASRHIEYDMRNDFFAHLETLPLAYFQAHRTGDLMSRATNDLSAVRMMIGPAVMYTASTVLTFTVALAMMLSIDARLTLVSLVPLPFVSFSVKYFGSAIHKRFEEIQAQLSDISAVVQEALSGVRVVRAYRQEAAELERFRVANEEYLQRNRRLIVLQGFFFPSMSFFLGLGALLVLWIGSQEVIRGRITVGQFVAFNAYLTLLSWPMIAFGWVTNMVQRGLASWKRMLEILDAEPAIKDEFKPQSTLSTPSQGFSAISAVSAVKQFSGRATAFALHDVGGVGGGSDGDASDGAGDDEPALGIQLQPEADVDAAELEEAAAERTAGEPRRHEHRKERAAAHQDVPGRRGEDDELVDTVRGADVEPLERGDVGDVDAVAPVTRAPRAQHA